MNAMLLSHRIGLFLVEVNCFRGSCLPHPTHVLNRVHYHLPVVAASANNMLLGVIKVINTDTEQFPHFPLDNYSERGQNVKNISKMY